MPGQVKIGKTSRTPEERCAEINSTVGTGGVPAWHVQHYIEVPDRLDLIEQSIHSKLADARVSKREIFTCSVAKAIAVVDEFACSGTTDCNHGLNPSEVLRKARVQAEEARVEAEKQVEDERQMQFDTLKQAEVDAVNTFFLSKNDRKKFLAETVAVLRADLPDAEAYVETYSNRYQDRVRSRLQAVEVLRLEAEQLAGQTCIYTEEWRQHYLDQHLNELKKSGRWDASDLKFVSQVYQDKVRHILQG